LELGAKAFEGLGLRLISLGKFLIDTLIGQLSVVYFGSGSNIFFCGFFEPLRVSLHLGKAFSA
jgi:hypothetical protein